MSKLTYMNIQGKVYPMSFSLMATKILTERHGDIQKYFSSLQNTEDTAKNLEIVAELLEVMISQGCAYKNYFEKDVPRRANDAVDDTGKFIPLSKDAILCGLEIDDVEYCVKKIQECMEKSNKRILNTVPTQKQKNEDRSQM